MRSRCNLPCPRALTSHSCGCARQLRQGIRPQTTVTQHRPQHIPNNRRAGSEVSRVDDLVDECHIVSGQVNRDRPRGRLVNGRVPELTPVLSNALIGLGPSTPRPTPRGLLVNRATQHSPHPVRRRRTSLRSRSQHIGFEDFTQIHVNRRRAGSARWAGTTRAGRGSGVHQQEFPTKRRTRGSGPAFGLTSYRRGVCSTNYVAQPILHSQAFQAK